MSGGEFFRLILLFYKKRITCNSKYFDRIIKYHYEKYLSGSRFFEQNPHAPHAIRLCMLFAALAISACTSTKQDRNERDTVV